MSLQFAGVGPVEFAETAGGVLSDLAPNRFKGF
jgi:hypothetical protein